MTARPRLGIVLFQLGGPDGPDSVEPFLYNLFSDPDIIDLPLGWLLRRPLARWIARRRSAQARAGYAAIGGGSPIRLLTERQARALEAALRPHVDAVVVVAMRYWHPFTSEAVASLARHPFDDVVLLPLYPQYSVTTTGSALNEWRRCFKIKDAHVHIVDRFYGHPGYIAAVVEKIALCLPHFSRGGTSPGGPHLIFSAHSTPVSFVERGDPYQREIEETVRLVIERGRESAPNVAEGLSRQPPQVTVHSAWPSHHTLCYQSKVGRRKWLEPSLTATIERLAGEGVKQMLVVPISFVSEHIETLHEINDEARALALRLGVTQFEMVPAVGDSPRFIAALADLALRAAQPK